MQISRLRLRLAAWFGAAFLLGLLVLDVGFLIYASRKAEAKLTRDVVLAAENLDHAIRQERSERPGESIEAIVTEVMGEWPRSPGVSIVYDSTGRRLGARGDSDRVAAVAGAALPGSARGSTDVAGSARHQYRIAWIRDSLAARVTVVTASSTFAVHEDEEALVGWLLLSVPLIGLGAAGAGYVLARRALRRCTG